MFSPKKNFSSKCSFGHVECSFDNPVKKHVTVGRKLSAQVPKKTTLGKFFKKIFFPKFFQWTRRLEFRGPFEQILPESQKRSAHCPKMCKQIQVFQKNELFSNFSSIHVKRHFVISVWRSLTKRRKKMLKVGKWQKTSMKSS